MKKFIAFLLSLTLLFSCAFATDVTSTVQPVEKPNNDINLPSVITQVDSGEDFDADAQQFMASIHSCYGYDEFNNEFKLSEQFIIYQLAKNDFTDFRLECWWATDHRYSHNDALKWLFNAGAKDILDDIPTVGSVVISNKDGWPRQIIAVDGDKIQTHYYTNDGEYKTEWEKMGDETKWETLGDFVYYDEYDHSGRIIHFLDGKNRYTEKNGYHFNLKPIFNGFPDGRLGPYDKITRAQLVAVMAKALEIRVEPTATNYFVDIDHSWAKEIINSFAEKGLLKNLNTPNNQFMPNNNVTQAEMFILFLNWWDYIGYDYMALDFSEDKATQLVGIQRDQFSSLFMDEWVQVNNGIDVRFLNSIPDYLRKTISAFWPVVDTNPDIVKFDVQEEGIEHKYITDWNLPVERYQVAKMLLVLSGNNYIIERSSDKFVDTVDAYWEDDWVDVRRKNIILTASLDRTPYQMFLEITTKNIDYYNKIKNYQNSRQK